MNENQEEPLTVLVEGAVALHELFTSYIKAGFTEKQALFFCAELLKFNFGNTTAE